MQAIREGNLARVLQIVERSPGSSRASVAAASGLTRATVSSLVETLIGWGFLEETGRAVATSTNGTLAAGRPGTPLALTRAGAVGLGIEVNVDYLSACLVDLTGDVVSSIVKRGDQRGRAPKDTLADAAALAVDRLDVAAATKLRVVGAAVAVPGLVGPDGRLAIAPNLDWNDVDVRELLRVEPALAALSMTVDNEANCAAIGELDASRGEEASSFLYVSGEIGIGAALVLDATTLRGMHGWSGELGHMGIDPDGPPCSCGSRGCLEQYAGQEVLLRAAAASDAVNVAKRNRTAPTIERVVELAKAGDAPMKEALTSAGTALGIGLASAVNLLDITDVVLGGVFRPLAPWLTTPIRRELDHRVVSRRWTDITVRSATRGSDGAMVGAGLSVVRAVRSDPAAWAPTPR